MTAAATYTKYLIYDPASKKYLTTKHGGLTVKWTPLLRRASAFLFKVDALLNLKMAQRDAPTAGIVAAEFSVSVKHAAPDPRFLQNDPSFAQARKSLAEYLITPPA